MLEDLLARAKADGDDAFLPWGRCRWGEGVSGGEGWHCGGAVCGQTASLRVVEVGERGQAVACGEGLRRGGERGAGEGVQAT